jgi:uncharacterized membrane protein
MKKVFALLLALSMVVMCLAGAASAKVRKFDFIKCSVDVPNGWDVEEDEENYTVTLTAPDESAITLSAIEGEGVALKDAAQQLSEQLNGTTPEANGDVYTFSIDNGNGVISNVVVSGDEEFIVFVTVTGEHEDIAGVIESIEEL